MNYKTWSDELLAEADKIHKIIENLKTIKTRNSDATIELIHRITCLEIEERDLRCDAFKLLERSKKYD